MTDDRRAREERAVPAALVQVLLDGALEPVIADVLAGRPEDPVGSLLDLAIVDPACGSGQLLLAAARRLASHVARLRAGGPPSEREQERALREVIARCIHGVDRDERAAEQCKQELWQAATGEEASGELLGSHIQVGDALLGTVPDLMAGGIPDAAWAILEGDEPAVARSLEERNRQEAGSHELQPAGPGLHDVGAQARSRAAAALEIPGEVTLEALARRAERWSELLGSAAYRRDKQVADAWCAAFVWPKVPGPLVEAAPTQERWRRLRDGEAPFPALAAQTVVELAGRYRFFHWHLQFPQVFARGGFDVILADPPWRRVAFSEREFFAMRRHEIAGAPSVIVRKQLISRLAAEEPALWEEWRAARRRAAGRDHFIRRSGRYPFCGQGALDASALFAEHARRVLGPRGRAGTLVPGAIATTAARELIGALVDRAELAAVYRFEAGPELFPELPPGSQLALLLLDASGRSEHVDLASGVQHLEQLAEPARHVSLSSVDLRLLSPNTRTLPALRSRRDAEILLGLYRRAGALWRDGDPDGNPWGLRIVAASSLPGDTELLRGRAELRAAGWALEGSAFVRDSARMLPVIEGRMVDHFDHRAASYDDDASPRVGQKALALDDEARADPHRVTVARYWIPAPEVEARLRGRWHRDWLLGWRDLCRSADRRTLVASLFPRGGTSGLSLLLVERDARLVACLYANLCALCCDYAARQRISGAHLRSSEIKQLPVLPPGVYAEPAPWDRGAPLRDWICRRVLELSYTAWDLEPFARDCSYEGPPFRWDSERRFALRAELDAAFFRAYGVSRDDVGYILDTFPVVKRRDEKAHGAYRTKRTILEIYDALDAATRSLAPYRSPLYP